MRTPVLPPVRGTPPPASLAGRRPLGQPAPGVPRAWPAVAGYVPGFILFIILNATLFLRPSEIIPAVEGWHIYQVLILFCLAVALPVVLFQLAPAELARRPITVCVLGILVMAVMSHLGRFHLSKKALENCFEIVKIVIYFLLLVGIINTPARLRGFLFSFGVFSFILTVLAVLNYHGVVRVINLSVLKDYLVDPHTGEMILVPRLRGTGVFNDPNDLCLVLVVGVMISLYGLTDRRLGPLRLFWVGALILFVYALYLTKSRGGFLGLVAGLMVFLGARFGGKKSLLLAGLLLPVLFVLFAGRQTDLSATGNTGQDRIRLWNDGLVEFKGSPFLGIGIGEYAEKCGQVAHNSFLHTFTELGFLGGLFFLGAFVAAFTGLRRLGSGTSVIIDPELRRLRPYLLGLVAAYAAGMMTLSVCYIVPTYTILGLAGAFLAMAAVYPPRPGLRFDGPLLARVAVAGVLFLGAMYVFVRLFVRY